VSATLSGPADIQETTRSRLLTEAAALFRERGFAATATREISARLGINKASLYYHIPSKEALLHEICLESLRRTTLAITEALEQESDPAKQMTALIHAHIESMLADFAMHATVLFEMRCLTGEYFETVKRSRDEYEGIVRDAVRRAQSEGALRADKSPKQLTMGLFNVLNWTLSWYVPGGDLSPNELADVLADLFLHGAKPRD